MNRVEVLGKILCNGLVPIIVDDRLPALPAVEELLAAGVEVIEVSCRSTRALAVVGEIKKRFPDFVVGVATLLEDGKYREAVSALGRPVPRIDQAVEAGADFLVSMLPFREATYRRYASTQIFISGVTTPGEAQQALDWGANLVKFSRSLLPGGPAFFKNIDPATHRGFPFFLTGGMRPELLGDYVEAQVLVFGAGFDLILGSDYEAMTTKFVPGRLKKVTQDYLEALRGARRKFQPQVPFESKDAAAIARASGRCLNVGNS
jgi:2-dehydro-3-deoxyphosphogluconate aldolase/(4S)-4-hydroxy-2-oxoglutarate aldolase